MFFEVLEARLNDSLLRIGQYPIIQPVVPIDLRQTKTQFLPIFRGKSGQFRENLCFAHETSITAGFSRCKLAGSYVLYDSDSLSRPFGRSQESKISLNNPAF